MKFLSIFLIGVLAISLVGLFNFNYAFAVADEYLFIAVSSINENRISTPYCVGYENIPPGTNSVWGQGNAQHNLRPETTSMPTAHCSSEPLVGEFFFTAVTDTNRPNDSNTIAVTPTITLNQQPIPKPDPVIDTIPPVIVVPTDITIDAADPFGSTYTFSATSTDIADPNPIVECTPPSGSVFPLGTTTVTCTATDASGNQSSDSFDVTVQVSAATFDGFAVKVESMNLQKGIENSLVSKIDAAAKSFDKGKTKTLINQLEAFVNEVNAQDKKKLSEEQAALLLEYADLLTLKILNS